MFQLFSRPMNTKLLKEIAYNTTSRASYHYTFPWHSFNVSNRSILNCKSFILESCFQNSRSLSKGNEFMYSMPNNSLIREYSKSFNVVNHTQFMKNREKLINSYRQNPSNVEHLLDLSQNFIESNEPLYALWFSIIGLLIHANKKQAIEPDSEAYNVDQHTLSELYYAIGKANAEMGNYNLAKDILNSSINCIGGNSNAETLLKEIEDLKATPSHFVLPRRRNKIDRSVKKNEEYFSYLSSFLPNSKLEIRDTNYAGCGVFAIDNIKKGERIYHEHTTFMVNGASFSSSLCSTCGSDLPIEPITMKNANFCSKSCHSRGIAWANHSFTHQSEGHGLFPSQWYGVGRFVIDPSKGDEDGLISALLHTPNSAFRNIPLLISRIAAFTLSHESFPCETDSLPPFIMLSSSLDRDYDGDYLKHKFDQQRLELETNDVVSTLLEIQTQLHHYLSPYFDMEWMINLTGILMANAFVTNLNTQSHTAQKEKHVNLALFPGLASYFNHSCVNNAEWVATGNLFMAYATRDIEKGEEVTISYIPHLTTPLTTLQDQPNSTLQQDAEQNVENSNIGSESSSGPSSTSSTWAQRQTALMRYNFECKCPKCKLEKDLSLTSRYV